MNEGPKRKRSSSDEGSKESGADAPAPASGVVEGDLTRDRIEEFFGLSLNDRQRLCWAYQTETKVRLEKVENRENLNVSTTLDSEYLFEIYPEIEERKSRKSDPLRKDRHLFARKCHPVFSKCREVDESFESILRLDVSNHEQHENHVGEKSVGRFEPKPVPPNFLFFTIILEAYMGYRFDLYHSSDPLLPRAAVMGGSVVAALTAWRDKRVIELFDKANLSDWFCNPCKKKSVDEYIDTKHRLLDQLNDWFFPRQTRQWRWPNRRPQLLLHQQEVKSCFGRGDVDIFLQSSPFTRGTMQKLCDYGTDDGVRDAMKSFIGGCGFVQPDLERMSKAVFESQRPESDTEIHDSYTLGELAESYNESLECFFVCAVTKNAVNSILVAGQYSDPDECRPDDGELRPRTTQLIMLSEKADLVGGLLDFDISICACSFDGNVRVAPRAAFSLLTATQIVTPFVMKEKRNWQRIVKYYKRGFQPYVVDPNCSHDTQCSPNGILINAREAERTLDGPARTNTIRNQDVYDFQRQNGQIWCCGCERPRYRYSFVVFEKEEANVMDFFSRYNGWSHEQWSEFSAVDPRQRVACRECRYAYEKFAFLKSTTDDSHVLEDFFNERMYCRQQRKNLFSPCFYAGGVFDSCRVLNKDYGPVKVLRALQTQLEGEETKYFIKNGTKDGFKPRFVFGRTCHDEDGKPSSPLYLDGYHHKVNSSLQEIFNKASKMAFPESSVPAVGLNPERFIECCKTCQKWLHDCEFNAEYCENCISTKPAPADESSTQP